MAAIAVGLGHFGPFHCRSWMVSGHRVIRSRRKTFLHVRRRFAFVWRGWPGRRQAHCADRSPQRRPFQADGRLMPLNGPARPTAHHRSPRWAAGVTGLTGFLLISYGGGIVAAPVTLPFLHLALRQPLSPGLRRAAITVATLTAAEAGWALAYVIAGEARPWVWLIPVVAAGAALLGAMATGPLPSGPLQ